MLKGGKEGKSNLLPTVPLLSGYDEWAKIAETIEQVILPQLESNWASFFAPLKFLLSGSSDKSINVGYHSLPVPSKYVLAHIGFLLRGEAAISIGERKGVFKAPLGIFVPRGVNFELHGEVNGQVPYGEWLTFTVTTFGAYVLQCRVTPKVHYEGKPYLVIHPGLAPLVEKSCKQTTVSKVVMMAVFGLLARANPSLPTFWELLPPSFVEMPSVLRQALQLLHYAYERPLRLKDVADCCHVNLSHLCRLFRQWTGMSPHAYLVKLRMSAAWKLLMETSLPPSLIASIVGYQKWSQFRLQFVKTFGVLPSQARKSIPLKPYSGWSITNIVSN